MSSEADSLAPPDVKPSRLEMPLGFALSFLSGRGLLTTKDRHFGPLDLKVLELEIPHIAFPFDVTGGADRFKAHRCALRHVVFGLDADGVTEALKRTDLTASGFLEIKAAVRDGMVELAGRFAIGEHKADFTMRAALLLRSPRELALVFYDTRVYGWLPVPSSLLPEYLRRGLALPYVAGDRAGAWALEPIVTLLREIMPRNGWKIPDMSRAGLVAAEVTRGQIVIVGGPEGEPSARQIAEREPPAAAVRAGEGVATYARAEELLAQGRIQDAYELFRESLDDERGGPWARERLLQIGAADPELALETRQLAEEALGADADDVQALLALASIAVRERSWGEAANRYAALAELSRIRKERFDTVAAELASAAAAAPIDPAGALAAYERAAARARDSITAHRALFELRRAQGDWNGAAQAGERLCKLEADASERVRVHRRLAALYRDQVSDLRRARLHYERALRITPDDPGSLEGLAETYAARGEPARAASYLARLAEHAEASGDAERVVVLNLRLGEIWERWLADPETAASRYHHVLDVDPRNRTARLRLAKLAEEKGEIARARALYEDLLAVEEERGDPEAVPDLVAAYTRLARVTLAAEGATAEAIACLERAVELDPTNRPARDQLARVLRERGEWGRLVRLLEETARVASTPEEARRSRIDAARLELEQRRDRTAARKHLEEVLELQADDVEAMDLIVPVLEAEADLEALAIRLSAAAGATTEPSRRGAYLLRLARARRQLDQPLEAERRDLDLALDADPFLFAAAEALVRVAEAQEEPHKLARALERFITAAPSEDARADALLRRGTLLWRELHRPEEALPVLAAAAAANPTSLVAHTTLAELYASEQRVDEAREALENALELAPEPEARSSLHCRIAELARAQDDAAGEAYHLIETIEGGRVTAALCDRLIEVLTAQGLRDRAALLIEKWAAAEGPAAELLWLRTAEVRRSLGELERAIAIYRDLVGRRGESAAEAAGALEAVANEHGDLAAVAEALRFRLDHAPVAEQPALLARLIQTQEQSGDAEGVEVSCERLLEVDAASVLAHRTLAAIAEQRGEWEQALHHLGKLLFDAPRDEQRRAERRRGFERAAGIANELAPGRVAELRLAFDEEFPEATPGALSRTLAEQLAAEESWEPLLALRRRQLAEAGDEASAQFRREVAEILHLQLGRSEEAIPFYQDVIAAEPSNLATREALVDIFARLERWPQLASLLFAMSQLVEEPAAALDYGLRSAELYAERVGDETAAVQILDTLGPIAIEAEEHRGRYAEALRKYELYPQLAEHLERVIGASPDPEDPRFAELVELFAGAVGDVPRAGAWCARMIEAFPDSDTARGIHLRLIAAYPDAGDAGEALRAWAMAREGPARARILVGLAEHLRASGDRDGSLAVLAEAAEADPTNEELIEDLVERHTGRGDWVEVAAWLERLAFGTEPGPEREERLRRLVDAAVDLADLPDAAARGLRALDERSPAESRLLAQVYIQQANTDGLCELGAELEALDRDLLLAAARVLCGAGRLDEARPVLERAMDQGALVEAWDLATGAWRRAERLAELGHWRFARSEGAGDADRAWLQLLGRAELIEAGEEPPEGGEEIEAQLAAADLRQAASAWAVFSVAQSSGLEEWAELAADSLLTLLDDTDARLVVALRHVAAHELATGSPERAAELARRLLELAAPEAERLLERALEAAGRAAELLELLERRAERGGADAPALWLRIARLEADEQRWDESAAALSRVEDQARDRDWAELYYNVALAREDIAAQAEAAGRLAAAAHDEPVERASWLRLQARLLWWQLDRAGEARQLLAEAHALVPCAAEETLAQADVRLGEDDRAGARRALEEGLAVLQGPDTAGLWLQRANLYAEEDDKGEVVRSLERAAEVIGERHELWRLTGVLAREAGADDLALTGFGHAFELDPQHESEYVDALERGEHWARLATLLEERAADLEGEEAAERLDRAARLARDRLDDRERALTLMQQSIRAAVSLERLRAAFEVAEELERFAAVAVLGPLLADRLETGSGERLRVQHRLVEALAHLGLEVEARPGLEELCAHDGATPAEKRMLAGLVAGDDPARAAALTEEVAATLEGDEVAPGLFEATRAWRRAGRDDDAARLLSRALELGLDELEAHHLALELLDGAQRLACVARVLELDGDADMPAAARAALRLELAQARLEQGEAAAAHELLEQANELGRPAGWVLAMEAALTALNRREELVGLWIEHAQDGTWSGAPLAERLHKAASHCREAGDVMGELRALQLLGRLHPEDAAVQQRLVEVAAELGSMEDFLAHVEDELQATAGNAEARAQLALRYAPILMERFDDPAAAAALLGSAFEEAPSMPLAEALARAQVAAGNAEAAVAVLAGQADRAGDDRQHVYLLLRAAGVAQGHAGDEEAAYGLYRRVLDTDAGVAEARDFCLRFAEEAGRWTEAVGVLERCASAAARSPGEAHGFFLRAALIAGERLDDAQLELRLLEAAVDADPTAPDSATRLLELRLAGDETDGALGLILGGCISPDRELELGMILLAALGALSRAADARRVEEHLAERHPDSAVAGKVRLEAARAAADHAGVLREVEAKLARDGEVAAAERHALLAEAGRAALEIGDKAKALEHLVGALAAESPELDLLLETVSLAEELQDDDKLAAAVQRAARLRDPIARRAKSAGSEHRVDWLILLARAHEAAGAPEAAQSAFEAALSVCSGPPPKPLIDNLTRMYTHRGDWKRLVRMYGKQVLSLESAAERAELHYRMAVIWQERLVDEERAGDAFAASLQADPEYAPAQLAYGLLQCDRNQFGAALPLLERQVDPESLETPIEHVIALAESLRETDHHERALGVMARILARDPSRHDFIASRAEVLEKAGRLGDAGDEWMRYLEVMSERVPVEEIAGVRRRLTDLALRREDRPAAVEHLEEAFRLQPQDTEMLVQLRSLYEDVGCWADAAKLRQREASLAPDAASRSRQLQELAGIYLDKLDDPDHAAAMLERACEAAPTDAELLRRLLALHERRKSWGELAEAGERLLEIDAEADTAAFVTRLARAYRNAGKQERAKTLYSRALAGDPEAGDTRAEFAAFCKETEDWATYADLEQAGVEALSDPDEQVSRLVELAELSLQRLSDVERAAAALARAHELHPNDADILRSLGNTYALDPKLYDKAADIYRALLAGEPLDAQTLRILARLSGQVGDNDHAYGYYAALLALQPSDEEAKRFVEACRPAVPAGPQRALTDADRVGGLIHPDQSGALEDLYAPLARFAELTHPGNLAAVGVADRDLLAATDPRLQWMKKVLDPLGLPQAGVYLWRGGGFACRTELLQSPAILVGSSLASDASDRQRAFLVARAAELYRTGHTLCEKLPTPELAGLAAALCLAVRPDCSPPGAATQTAPWANTIAAPMTEPIRASMAARVDAYLAAAAEIDVGRWRWASLASASRVAMLVSCDVEEAVSAVLRLDGMDDLSDEQRAAVIRESPEALDLFRFGVSAEYFTLRRALGLALRRSG